MSVATRAGRHPLARVGDWAAWWLGKGPQRIIVTQPLETKALKEKNSA